MNAKLANADDDATRPLKLITDNAKKDNGLLSSCCRAEQSNKKERELNAQKAKGGGKRDRRGERGK